MGDDYLVRSGAKELLAHAVASLLEIRPANPVLFLAHRFDTTASSVQRSVRLLRACPPQTAAFQDAMFQAFRWLSTDASSVKEPPMVETMGVAGLSLVPRPSYERVLQDLSSEFPVHVRDRVLDALRATHERGGASIVADVTMDEFQRGVRVCALLEELFDVVDELFFSIDKGGGGDVKLAVVLSALENAAHHATSSGLDDAALDVLKIHLRSRHQIAGLTTTTTPLDGDSPTVAPPLPNDDETHRSLRLVDLQEIVFHAVFTH